MSNFVELLLSAALSKESTNKINTQIKNIQKDLKDITIDFNVNNSNNKTFSEMEKQIKSLQRQLKDLQSQLGNVGNGNSSKSNPYISGISEEAIKASKSLTDLKRQLTQDGYAVKVDFDYDKNGLKTVKHVLAEIKNQAGQVETLKIKPVVDNSGNSTFSLYGSSNSDKNTKGFIDNQNKAIQMMEQFSRQGKLTAKDIEDYTKRINKANDNTSLQRTVDQMKELSKISSSDNKHHLATKNLNDQAKQSLATLENLRMKAANIGMDTKHIDSLINKMRALSKIEITNDAQVGKADKLFSTLSSRVSNTKNNLDSLITAQNKFNQILNSAQNKGVFNTGELERFRNQLNLVIGGSEKLGDKLTRLKSITSSLNNELGTKSHTNKMAEGMKKAQLEVDKLQASLLRVVNSYKRTVDMNNANAIKSDLNRFSNVPTFSNATQIKEYMNDLKSVQNRIHSLNSEATQSARANMGVIDSFRTAMEKFPVWMIASTAFYAPIRGLQDLTEKVVELDTAITNLRRVMDLPDYKFNEMLEQSIVNVSDLSAKTSDYLKILGEFGRTGLDDKESLAMANTATLLQNISELTPDEAFNSLTSAMISFGIEAENSITIADKLNEVDNNFAITTRDLSLAMNKSASTAKTFGVSLDELLGYTTAIGSATRESGNIVGNSLKTIMSRITTNGSAIDALAAIGVSINDIGGNVRPVSDIIEEVAGKWDSLTDQERQNTAVKTAGVYQLSRWNALMINYKMGQDAASASMNSFNSATREQLKYNDSLQARINRLNTSWYNFASTVGDSVLYDSIVVITQGLKATTDAGSSAISGIGALAPLFGIVGIAAYGLSGTLRGLIASTYAKVAAFASASASNKLYAVTFLGLGGAAKFARVAIMGLLAATGVGLVFAGVGYAIEKVVSAMSELIQKQEQIDQYNKQNIDALTLNKESTEELIESYKNLSQEKTSSKAWNTDKEEEYLRIQNTLAEVFPALVDSIDSTGQSHLKKESALLKEIEATEKLIDAQNRLTLSKAIEEFGKFKDTIDGHALSSASNFFFGNLDSQIKNTEMAIKSLSEKGVDTAEQEIKLINLQREYQSANEQIKAHIYSMMDSIESLNGTEINSNLSESVKNFVSELDISNLNEDELTAFGHTIGNLQIELQKAFTSGNASSFNGLITEINELASSSSNFEIETDKLTFSYEELLDVINAGNGFVDTAMDEFGYGAEAFGEMGKEIEDLIESISKLDSVEEKLLGVSNAHVESSNELVYMYEALSGRLNNLSDEELNALRGKQNLTAEEQLLVQAMSQRETAITHLNVLYPHYAKLQENQISLTDKQIEAMKREEKANQVLLEAYKLAREGKLSSEQNMTVTAAQGTKNRIEILKKELLALDAVFQKYKEEASKLTATSTGDGADKQLMSAISERTNLTSDLNDELDTLANFSVEIDGFVNKINDSTSKSNDTSKEANKTTKESIYLTDKYKQSLEALELAIERQQAIQAQHPEHSEKYRKSLESQLKLEREKLNLIKSQSDALNKQIKSGKIAQTGKVTIEEDGSTKATKTTTKSASNRKLSGWEGTITDTYGTKRAIRNYRPHTGVDLAGKTGTRLDSNVRGKVIKADTTALSGNHVQILDENGMKHFYGHLDKIVAKLGDVVEVGTHIGNIGNTGNSSGSHLHYEIKNAQGKNFDPMEYVKAAKQSQTITQSVSQNVASVVSTTAQSIDDAKSTLNGLQSDVLNSQETIAKLEQAIIESQLGAFEFKKSEYDSILSYEEAKLKNVTEGTDRYTKTLEKQESLLSAKQRVNNEELAYVEGLIKTGKLSAITLEQMKSRTMELKTSIESLNNEIGRLALDKLFIQYDNYLKKQDATLDFENNKLAELDRNSTRYVATLEKLLTHQQRKHTTNQQEINDLQSLIKSGKLQGELLTEAKDKIQGLTLEMQSLNQEMSDTNFEIIVSIKNTSDEKVDDLNDSISVSQKIQALHKEGSIEATAEIDKQVESYEKLAQIHDNTRRALKAELGQRDLLPERIKEVTELLEDETNAYWDAVKASKELTESIEEHTKQSREELANKVVDAYKDAMQEMQDDHMRSLDERVEAEEKAHEKRMKQLEDEMDLYRESVEEKLELIDKQEADRDFNMEMDELITERSKVQDQINLLSMDDSHEAKSKRKKLQEDLDKIDKDINEKRHDRNIDLQKENLNNLLEDKEVEIEKREELEESRHEKVITEIEDERKYWTKHYTDLLNDERKFAQLRKDIIAGHFDKVQAEFNGYIGDLKDTMPELEDTLNGTMKAVGTSIRQNVIDNLKLAMEEIDKLTDLQSKVSDKVYSDNFNPNSQKDTTYSGNTSSANMQSNSTNGNKAVYESLSNEDYRVMLGKYINDEIAPQYKAMTDDRIALKGEGERVALLGRNNGSIIPKNSSFDVELKNFSPAQIERLKSFINNNAGSLLGGKYKSKMTSGIASLDSGGMIKRLGQGIDGKGGGLSIVHPNEVVETPYDVDQLVKHSSILDRIMNMVAPMISKLPQLNLPTMSSVTGDNIEVHFHVDEMIANKSTADSFANKFAEKIRTTKGGLRK